MEDLKKLLLANKNLILTGAPGTGKTYETAKIAVAICDGVDKVFNSRESLMKRYKELVETEKRIAFITFHQSFDYEEFVEGLKPDINETTGQGEGTYSVNSGIFKEICDRAKEKNGMTFLNDAIEKLKEECSETAVKVKNKSNYEFSVTYREGKTFRVRSDKSEAEEGRDFPANIDSIRKFYQGEEKGIYNKTYVWGILNYLKQVYTVPDYKEDNSDKKYVLIIDEINRGNISKIFGELITLLEKDKRLGEVNEITTTLPYSQEKFGVPSNLYIVGTMNTADRSIGHIDYAIRRRFAFQTIQADINIVETIPEAKALFEKIKSFITENINEDLDADDLMIGHSYFICNDNNELAMRLKYEIIPLIEEYQKDGIIIIGKKELKEKIEKWNVIVN